MTLVAVPGGGMWLPIAPTHDISQTPSGTNVFVFATGEAVAYIGRVWNVDRSSKSIERVGFALGTSALGSTSSYVLSLQNVSTVAGSPFRPDGTQDQTVTMSSTYSGFQSGAVYMTDALSANRSVSYGELLAVVIEYSSAGQLGTDSLALAQIAIGSDSRDQFSGIVSRSSGGTWSFQNGMRPMMFLKFTDGSYGSLDFSFTPGSSAVSFQTFASNTSSGSGGDERGLRFMLPFTCKVDAAYFNAITPTSSTNIDIVLYQGTTALRTHTVNAIQTSQALNSARAMIVPFDSEQTLTANTEYIVAVKPTTTNATGLWGLDLSSDAYTQGFYNSSNFYGASRTDGGAWDFNDLFFPFVGVRISAVDNGTATVNVAVANKTTFVSDQRELF